MRKIAILVCGKTVGYGCTGSSCIKAMNGRIGTFSRYEGEEVELQAFFQCSGCDNTLEEHTGLRKKMDRILELNPDALHVGVCTIEKDTYKRCKIIKELLKEFIDHGIEVVNGTHGSERLDHVIEE